MNTACRILAAIVTLPAFLAGVLLRPFWVAFEVGCHAVDEQVEALFPEISDDDAS